MYEDEQRPDLPPQPMSGDPYIAPNYPVAPDDADFNDPPTWPKVVGIISISWGTLALCCNMVGVLALAFSGSLLKMAENQGAMSGPFPPIAISPPAYVLVPAGLGVLWVVFLIVAGVTLVCRNPASRMLHLVYAVGSLLLLAVGAYAQMKYQAEIADWVALNPDSDFAKQQNTAGPFNLIGFVFGLSLSLIWPLFCLIWFAMVKRKATEITGGVIQPAA